MSEHRGLRAVFLVQAVAGVALTAVLGAGYCELAMERLRPRRRRRAPDGGPHAGEDLVR
jgi:hypothetical protein